MQQVSGEPFLHVPPDHLVASGMLPGRRDPDGPFARWGPDALAVLRGFHRCLPALAAAGNDLIAGHITEFRARREDLARLLEGLGDFLTRVRCDLAEIGRRERGRGYRGIGEVCPLSGASEEPGR